MAPCVFFEHGVCIKSKCPYGHDVARIPQHTGIACALRDFVSERGGVMRASEVGKFYSVEPRSKLVIKELAKFCAEHSHLLSFQKDKGSGMVRSVLKKDGAAIVSKLVKTTSNDPSADTLPTSSSSCEHVQEASVAQSLARFIVSNGGRVPASSGLGMFYKEHPGAKAHIGKIKPFCSKYAKLLRYEEVDGSACVVARSSKPRRPLVDAILDTLASSPKGVGIGKLGSVMRAKLPKEFSKEGSFVDLLKSLPEVQLRLIPGKETWVELQKHAPAASTKSMKEDTASEDRVRIALLWKDYLDIGRTHLIGQERDVMKAAFDDFLTSHQIERKRAPFGIIMATLQNLGFEEHGRWRSSSLENGKQLESQDASVAPAEGTKVSNELPPGSKASFSTCFRASVGISPIASASFSSANNDPWSDGADPWSANMNADRVQTVSPLRSSSRSVKEHFQKDNERESIKGTSVTIGASSELDSGLRGEATCQTGSAHREISGRMEGRPTDPFVLQDPWQQSSMPDMPKLGRDASRPRASSVNCMQRARPSSIAKKSPIDVVYSDAPREIPSHSTSAGESGNGNCVPLDRAENNVAELIEFLPECCCKRMEGLRGDALLWKLVLDLGSRPRAFVGKKWTFLAESSLTQNDLQHMIDTVVGGSLCDGEVAGIRGTLHRVRALFSDDGQVCGLTVHVRHTDVGVAHCVQDLLALEGSMLILGPRGSGKTALLRDAARICSSETHHDVMILDRDGEIGGFGRGLHASAGFARRISLARDFVPSVDFLCQIVESHLPDVLIVDEPVGMKLQTLFSSSVLRALHVARGCNLKVISAMRGSLEDLVSQGTFAEAALHSVGSASAMLCAIVVLPQLTYDADGSQCREWKVVTEVSTAVTCIQNEHPYLHEVRRPSDGTFAHVKSV